MAKSRRLPILIISLVLLGLTACKTCPIDACHVRMRHAHGEQEFRGQPFWKKQNPKIGENPPNRPDVKRATKNSKSKNKN